MKNSIEEYRESGKRAGKARKENDESRSLFESDWARRAINLERTAEERAAAQEAFNAGYKEGRGTIDPCPFR